MAQRQSHCLVCFGPRFDPKQGRNLSFLTGTGIRKSGWTEPHSLVPVQNLSALNPKFLCIAFVVKSAKKGWQ